TTLKTIIGLVKPRSGRVVLGDEDVTRLPTHVLARRGICLIPEDRQVFPNLTVSENLKMSRLPVDGGKRLGDFLDWVFMLFPRLGERASHKGAQLSGGEQQMLAIARGLMARPKLLLLDEPSLGLAPKLVVTIFETIQRINAEGMTILLVEQNAYLALKIAHRGYVLEAGRIVLTDTAKALASNPQVKAAYLGG
ncbi:MAG: ABC transporter ATP-binding protein, partial [Candidatus Omnitrophica bacterium]|nr:ABC transporter ATP-binding protein [Candidatus Omnitrophota bacterium]